MQGASDVDGRGHCISSTRSWWSNMDCKTALCHYIRERTVIKVRKTSFSVITILWTNARCMQSINMFVTWTNSTVSYVHVYVDVVTSKEKAPSRYSYYYTSWYPTFFIYLSFELVKVKLAEFEEPQMGWIIVLYKIVDKRQTMCNFYYLWSVVGPDNSSKFKDPTWTRLVLVVNWLFYQETILLK